MEQLHTLEPTELGDTCTVSGHPIRFAHPECTPVEWVDIYTQLSREPRYSGVHAWTVLDHLVLCVELGRARGLHDAVLGYLATHDAAEYVLKDLHPRLKDLLPEYRGLEERWSAHVHRSLGLVWPLPQRLALIVKYFDKRALVTEMVALGDRRSHVAENVWGLCTLAESAVLQRVQGMDTPEKARALYTTAATSKHLGTLIGPWLLGAEQQLESELEDFLWRCRRRAS